MVIATRNLLSQGSIFRGYVSFREGTCLDHFLVGGSRTEPSFAAIAGWWVDPYV